MIKFETDFSGAFRKIEKIERILSGDDRKMTKAISQTTAKSIERNFLAEGRPRWEERKGKYSHPILNRTGLTQDKAIISAQSDRWKKGNGEVRLEVITTDYGVRHQEGRVVGGVVRKFARFTEAEKQQVLKDIREAVNGG